MKNRTTAASAALAFAAILPPGLLAQAPGPTGDGQPAAQAVRSPFLPPGFGEQRRAVNQPTNTPLDQLEFRGLSKIGGDELFSLFDPSTSRGYWMRVGETQGGYTLVSFNPSASSVIIRSPAGDRTIPLRQITPPAAPAAAAGGRTGGGQRVGLVNPLANTQPPPPSPGSAAPMATSLPPGSFPLGEGQTLPPGFVLVRPLPSSTPGALPPTVTYALPPGSQVPPGFSPAGPVGQPGAPGATTPTQRRRIIVNQGQQTTDPGTN
jgi:hypothetical protein